MVMSNRKPSLPVIRLCAHGALPTRTGSAFTRSPREHETARGAKSNGKMTSGFKRCLVLGDAYFLQAGSHSEMRPKVSA
jgi:hypothetical protein